MSQWMSLSYQYPYANETTVTIVVQVHNICEERVQQTKSTTLTHGKTDCFGQDKDKQI